MSNCHYRKFVITKGLDNTFVFTIKADGSTLPMEIVSGDTFVAMLRELDTNTVVLTKSMTVTDMLSGKVELVITSAETDSLTSERGDKVDRYYNKPTYSLIVDANTQNNGNFIAKVSEIYVD